MVSRSLNRLSPGECLRAVDHALTSRDARSVPDEFRRLAERQLCVSPWAGEWSGVCEENADTTTTET
jgi:hypothetical protein